MSNTNSFTAIHGDKQQHERDWVLNEFKTGKSPIMVATDVASRGIGMIDCATRPLPFPQLTSCGSVCDALLSAKVCSISAIIRSRLVVSSFGSLARRTLDIQCSVVRYISHSVSLCTIRVPRRIGLSLTCSSCISKVSPGPR